MTMLCRILLYNVVFKTEKMLNNYLKFQMDRIELNNYVSFTTKT